MKTKYTYTAKVIKVYDGDTITCDIDLGFGVWLNSQKIRLLGINTPEIRGKEKAEGIKVRDIVRDRILNKEITLITKKDKKGKYGRWLGTVYIEGVNINEWLLKNNYAKAM